MAGSGFISAHPILVPGCRVLRRDRRTLQVGVGERLVLAPDTAEVQALLEALRSGAAQPPLTALPNDAARLLCELHDRGLVTDSGPLLRSLGSCPGPSAREQHAAAVLERGERHRRSRSNAGAEAAVLRVRVLDAGLPTWARHTCSLLEVAGLGIAASTSEADVVLLLSADPIDRRQTDQWMRDDVAHLLLDADDGRIRLGPFVLPGRSACLRCVDAFSTDRDPHHPLLVEQRRHAATPLGLPRPIAHDLVGIAAAMAVRELITHADGGTPATLASTIEIDPALELPTTWWGRHPSCGCSWDQLQSAQ